MKIKMAALAMAVAGAFMQRTGLALGALSVTVDKAEHTKLSKDVQALYVEKDGKFHLDLPEGFEDVTGMRSALEKERTSKREAEKLYKEFAKKYEGIDPEQVRRIMAEIDGDEEAALIKAGKIDDVVKKRMEKALKAHEKALVDKDKAIEAEKARTSKFSQRVLDNHIRAAATKAGLHANAVDDALFRARTIFTLNDDGDAVQLDGEGKPVMGKDSKTLFSPVEWLETMKDSAPHWFPANNTGGGSGGNTKNGGTKTIKRAAFELLNPVEKSATAAKAAKGELTIVD